MCDRFVTQFPQLFEKAISEEWELAVPRASSLPAVRSSLYCRTLESTFVEPSRVDPVRPKPRGYILRALGNKDKLPGLQFVTEVCAFDTLV